MVGRAAYSLSKVRELRRLRGRRESGELSERRRFAGKEMRLEP